MTNPDGSLDKWFLRQLIIKVLKNVKASKKKYDAIVIGLGSMGSAALYYLAKQGMNVLGIEQFGPLHEKGSYSGYSRIIRKAYFEHPDYVPLLEAAYNEWDHLEQTSGSNLFHKTGLLYIDQKNGPIGNGVLDSATKYQIEIDSLDVEKAKTDYPFFSLLEDSRILFEKNAGFLDVEKSLTILHQLGIQHGAECRFYSPVKSWKFTNNDVMVTLENGEEILSHKLVICGGAFTQKLVEKISLPLKITQQLLVWIETNLSEKEESELPCWTYCTPGDSRIFYGFPKLNHKNAPIGLKIAYHSPGETINPTFLSAIPKKEDLDKILGFLEKYMPGVFKKVVATKNCLYTNTPDEHFILDYLPDTDDRVIIATGFSGHGFKFIPAIGKIIMEWTALDIPHVNIDFLNSNRFGNED